LIDSFYKGLLKNKETPNYFFSAIQKERFKQDEERKLSYKWTGRLAPSSLSFSMCPYKFIREEVHKREVATSENRQKMELGKALHALFSEEAKRIENLLYAPNLPLDALTKSEGRYPEFAVVHSAWKISGYVDLCLNIKGKPVIADMKFPQKSEELWEAFLRNIDKEIEQHLTQVCIYAEVCNDLKYFDQPIETVAILYNNPLVSKNNIKEVYRPYTKELQEKTLLLLQHLLQEREKFFATIDSTCKYPLCHKHGKQ